MKKLMIGVLTSLLVLTACGNEEEQVELIPVTVSGLEVTVQNSMSLHSRAFDQQGKEIEAEYFNDEAVKEMLEQLGLEMPDMPEKQIEIQFELIDYEIDLTDKSRNLMMLETANLSTSGIVSFPELTFHYPGTYIFEVRQLGANDEDEIHESIISWTLNQQSHTVIVNVNYDELTNELVTTVEKETDLVFTNEVLLDLSEAIQNAIVESWQANGEEYIEEAAPPAATAPELERTPEAAPPIAIEPEPNPIPVSDAAPPVSQIPEDHAVTLSTEEALSYLALVNRHFRLASSFSPGDLSVVNVSSIQGTHLMRATAARAAEALFAAASEAGHALVATSGYRSYATQHATNQHWISVLGETEARRVSARPGHSEHQLGLALDITTHALGGLSQAFSATAEGMWVAQNAHTFGFIIRYPANREADTGYIYEPWHIRYVGVDAATAIFNGGMILEDFLR